MKPITELTKEDIADIKLVSFDCDGVTIEKGTQVIETEDTLTVKTHTISSELLQKIILLKKRFHINFSSGRSLLYLDRMYDGVLWEKASLQGENGIFTLIDGKVIQNETFSQNELLKIKEIKNAIRGLAKTNKDIKGFEPKQFLITSHCVVPVPEIPQIVKKYDPEDEFYCFWNGEAYDIGLKKIIKGGGLKNLIALLGIKLEETMMVGNDINDREIMEASGISITTDPKIEADFCTTKPLHHGGEEVVDILLGVI